jgi:hypothetical protein
MYSAANIRSVVSDGVNYWTAGSSGGIWYSANGATPIQIGNQNSSGNLRVARIFNGKLYFSTSSGTIGVWAFSGLPASTTTSAVLITNNPTTGSSPYDFAINPAGTVAYVADDSTLANGGGIQKFTFNGSVWLKQFTFGSANALTAGCRGLAVDFSGANPVIYATDAASPTKLIKITDTSAFGDTSDAVDQATILATAVANTAFRGVALAPVPSSPLISSQPADTNVLVGASVTLSVGATGNAPLSYQWYYTNSNTKLSDGSSGFGGTISGSTSASLILTTVNPAQAGGYQVIITNTIGSVTSRVVQVTVSASAVAPIITNQPTSLTVNAGDQAVFSATVGGTTPLTYQWKVDNGTTTNNVAGAVYSGTNTATLTIPSAAVNLSGLKYFLTITNVAGATNTAKATLIVNPPVALTVAQFRAKVDGSFAPTNTTTAYTLTGIVTTWTNMTASTTSSEFYMQDGTGGIAVFWSGGVPSSMPPAGAQVQVTGPMAAFNGLLEIEPVFGNPLHSVTIISTNNPLPKAQPLPFDPNLTSNLASMKALESSYFVASNVMLNLSTANFVSGANDVITNNVKHILQFTNSVVTFNYTNPAGQSVILFINANSGLPGLAKNTGPVTIYGVLGYFTSAGFELTPSRAADIISYVNVTNVLTNARKGDLATNSYTELVLRPGETLNTYFGIGDPEGGVVTLTPQTAGLSANSGWSGVTSGLSGAANFSFTPTSADAGSNYVVNLTVASTISATYTNTFTVYVPTASEQQIAISEFLANPTTNTGSAYFNPLKRSTDTIGISTNDQYIEVANQSSSELALGWTIDAGNVAKPIVDTFAVGGPVPAASSYVAYGGNQSEAVGLTTPFGVSQGLSLKTTGSGLLILRNVGSHIIDRVVYSATDLSTNGSLSRFPTINSAFVPQPYISTNVTTAGFQYDGGSWSSPTKTPTGVNNVGITYVNGKAVFSFAANTSQASTLWSASDVTGPYSVILGQPFPTGTGTFTNANSATKQFYFITTQ